VVGRICTRGIRRAIVTQANPHPCPFPDPTLPPSAGEGNRADAFCLARSVGSWIRWDPQRELYDHLALLAAIDQGRVVRLLVGATVPPRRLREEVWELRHDLVSTYPLPSEKVLFRCFGYDPRTGGVTLEWGLLLLLAPGLFTVVCTVWIFRGGRRERVRYGA
jgi:hypothetical protein